MAAPRRWLALVVVVVLVVSSFGALVAAGDSSSTAVDVVFLVDRSPSMADQADATTSSAMTFARELDSRSADGRFAVIAYANDNWTTLEQKFTADPDEAEAALSTMNYSQNSSENASLAVVSALDVERQPSLAFRSDATTVVVVFTDEDDDGYCELGDEAITALDERGAMLVAVASDPPNDPGSSDEPCLTDDTQNDLRVIAEEQVANGHWTDPADPDFEAVYDWLGLAEGSSGGDQEADRDAEFERVDHSINRSVVQVGEPVKVTVVVENVGTATGTYQSVLTGDLEILGTQTATLAPDDRHTFTWTVTFDEPEPQLRFFENYQWLGDVEVTAATPTPTPAGANESTAATQTATPTGTDESGATPTATPEETESTSTAAATPTPGDVAEDSPTSTQSMAAETETTTSVITDSGIGVALLVGGTFAAALLMVSFRRYR